MSPIIRIPETVYDKLQSIAEPFIDTPASVIERIVDYYEVSCDSSTLTRDLKNKRYMLEQGVLSLNPENPPSLIHTRIIKARVGDYNSYKWNDLVRAAHKMAMVKTGSIEDLARISTSRIMKGCFTESGYKYYKDIGMSIQGVNSNEAWKDTLNLAQKLDINVEVIFEWRNKRGASNPGKKGMFEWNPKGTP
ncbi:T4SS efffector SepA family protein [Candidatus Latescibacterota bacterium]